MALDPTHERTPPPWLESSLPDRTPAQVTEPGAPEAKTEQIIDLAQEEKSWEIVRRLINGKTDINRQSVRAWMKSIPNELLVNQLREAVSELPYYPTCEFRRTLELIVYVSQTNVSLANQIRGSIEEAYREKGDFLKKEIADSVIQLLDTFREAEVKPSEIHKYGLVVTLFRHLEENLSVDEQISLLSRDALWARDLDKRIIEALRKLSTLTSDVSLIIQNSIDEFAEGKISKAQLESYLEIVKSENSSEENDALHQYCFDQIRECFATPNRKSIQKAIKLSYVAGLLDEGSTRENRGISAYEKFLVSATDFSGRTQVSLSDGFKMLLAYSGGYDPVGDAAVVLITRRIGIPGNEENIDVFDLIKTSSQFNIPFACWLMQPKLLIDALENAYIRNPEKWGQTKGEFRDNCKMLTSNQARYLVGFLGEINPIFLDKFVDAIPWDNRRINFISAIVEQLDSIYERGHLPSADFMKSIGILVSQCALKPELCPTQKIQCVIYNYLNFLSQNDREWTKFESETFDLLWKLKMISESAKSSEIYTITDDSNRTLLLAFEASQPKNTTEVTIRFGDQPY